MRQVLPGRDPGNLFKRVILAQAQLGSRGFTCKAGKPSRGDPSSRGHGQALQAMSFFMASSYLAAVFSITSRGKRGAGGVLSQGLPLI